MKREYIGIKDMNGKKLYIGDIVMDRTYYEDLWPIKNFTSEHHVLIQMYIYWDDYRLQYRMWGKYLEESGKLEHYDDQLYERKLEKIGRIK